MTAWPLIVGYPPASMKTMPAFAWSVVGPMMSAAVMSAWPLGAFTRARRYASPCFKHQSRCCAAVFRGAGHAVEHEPKRLSADVGVDGSDHANHSGACLRLT